MIAIAKFAGFSAARPDDRHTTASLPVQLGLGLSSLVLVDSDAVLQQRLAYAIRAAMASKDWKAPDLAKALRRDASTVTRWANGESVPNLLMTKPLAEALGVRPELLFDPPPVPDYPLAEYLVQEAIASGVEEGLRRARTRSPRAGAQPAPSRAPRPLADGAGRG